MKQTKKTINKNSNLIEKFNNSFFHSMSPLIAVLFVICITILFTFISIFENSYKTFSCNKINFTDYDDYSNTCCNYLKNQKNSDGTINQRVRICSQGSPELNSQIFQEYQKSNEEFFIKSKLIIIYKLLTRYT